MLKTKWAKSEKTIMLDIMICLLAILLMSVIYYGWRALIVSGISVITCLITDIYCVSLRKKKYSIYDYSAINAGLAFSLLMPASIPYNILVISCIIMIVVGKQVFGGKENTIFNCVAVGYGISSICWKQYVLSFPLAEPWGKIDLASNVSDELVSSFTNTLDKVTEPAISNFDLILGIFTGPMGTSHIIVLAVCALTLLFNRSISFLTFFSCFGTIMTTAYLFPVLGASRGASVIFELVSGSMLFGVIFLACDYKSMPETKFARFVYGIIIAVLTIIFRRYSHVEVGIVYAVIIANVIAGSLDSTTAGISRMLRQLFKKRDKSFPKRIFKLIIPKHQIQTVPLNTEDFFEAHDSISSIDIDMVEMHEKSELNHTNTITEITHETTELKASDIQTQNETTENLVADINPIETQATSEKKEVINNAKRKKWKY